MNKTSADGLKVNEAIALLKHALTIPANKGGGIKQDIRKALEILEAQ